MKEKLNRQELLAKDRTHLANQRTLLAFWRTALAFFGAGVLVIKFFPDGIYIIIGEGAIVFGLILFIYGTMWYYKYERELRKI